MDWFSTHLIPNWSRATWTRCEPKLVMKKLRSLWQKINKQLKWQKNSEVHQTIHKICHKPQLSYKQQHTKVSKALLPIKLSNVSLIVECCHLTHWVCLILASPQNYELSPHMAQPIKMHISKKLAQATSHTYIQLMFTSLSCMFK